MRTIKGYVCIAKRRLGIPPIIYTEEIIFGKGKIHHQLFELNNLTPFSDKEEAKELRQLLLKTLENTYESISLGYINMSVIEIKEEWEQVKKEWQKTKSIIVIEVIDDPYWHETRMYGRIIRNENGQIDRTKLWDYKAGGARLRDNGFEPFEDIESAEDCARELTRQDESYVLFATFSLQRGI